jgi:hypothetical protein
MSPLVAERRSGGKNSSASLLGLDDGSTFHSGLLLRLNNVVQQVPLYAQADDDLLGAGYVTVRLSYRFGLVTENAKSMATCQSMPHRVITN